MEVFRRVRQVMKRIVLGPWDFPQQCTVGLRDPQSEVAVWLHGSGPPRDVTHNHLMACGAPFTIGIGFYGGQKDVPRKGSEVLLKFSEQQGERRVLGQIGLQLSSLVRLDDQQLCLFRVTNYQNYCLPRLRLWGRYLQYARQPRRPQDRDVPITLREARAMIVFYICPRPVVLVTVSEGDTGTIFPMNLMGSIGNGRFAFALNSNRAVAPLVERIKRVALSSVPLEYAPLAYQLGRNHRETAVDWSRLPFATRILEPSGFRVPEFALRVRDMHVEETQEIGSHTLFVGRTTAEERRADGLEFFVVHGMYQAYRQRMRIRGS
jgi:flavin reductase (DIM6/NTAB) family NADH-FMN oxidoreductase RutF